MRKLIIVFVLIGLSFVIPTQAATLNANDATSLIVAINTANSNGQDNIINLTADITLTTVDNVLSGRNGLPSITSNLTINGNGHVIRRDAAAPSFRIIHHASGALTLHDVVIENGYAEDIDTVTNAEDFGGGIYSTGNIQISNSQINNNVADSFGGGIYTSGGLNIFDSTINNNTAVNGGGVYLALGLAPCLFDNVRWTNNTALNNAGGLYSERSTFIRNNTFDANIGGSGAAFEAYSFMNVSNTTIMNNRSNFASIIFNGSGNLTLENTTISSNTTVIAIVWSAGTTRINNSTITNNTASGSIIPLITINSTTGTTTISNSIIAGNTFAVGILECSVSGSGVINTNASNILGLDGTGQGCAVGATDVSPVTTIGTILDPLANNGGPTQTHALAGGSIALNAALAAGATVADQRGVPVVGTRDIGAYEAGSTPQYPSIAFTVASASYQEAAATFQIELTITGSPNFNGTVNVIAIDTGAGSASTGVDYVTFPPFIITINCTVTCLSYTQNMPITINTDAIVEGDETIEFALVGGGLVNILTPDVFTLTIEDSFITTLTANDPNAAENPSDNGQFTVDLGEVNTTGSPIAINYSIAGTATNGTDYTLLSGTVYIPNGQQTAVIDVIPTNDFIAEAAETVILQLTGSPSPLVTIVNTPAIATIQSDDVAGVTINPLGLNITEGGTSSYSVVLNSQPAAGETVTITVAIDAAASGEIASTSALTINFDDTNWNIPQNFDITLNDDLIVNGNRNYPAAFTHASDSTSASSGYAAAAALSISGVDLTVTDDETPNVVINPTAFSLTVGTSQAYDVYLTIEPSADVTVTLTQLDANCTVAPLALTFTDSLGANPWNVPQQVMVTGIGAAGSTCTIQHGLTGGGYAGVIASDVIVTLQAVNVPGTPSTTPGISVFDPAISKFGVLLPGQTGAQGEKLEWIVTVSNVSSVAGQNVTITDQLNAALQIDSVDAPNASVSITGQTVSVTYATLNPGETVQFSIFTTVLDGATVDNTACVTADNQSAEECATALPVGSLPNTGEAPTSWSTLR